MNPGLRPNIGYLDQATHPALAAPMRPMQNPGFRPAVPAGVNLAAPTVEPAAPAAPIGRANIGKPTGGGFNAIE